MVVPHNVEEEKKTSSKEAKEEVIDDSSRISNLAMEFMDKLDDEIPEDAKLIGVAIVAEVTYDCPGCKSNHTLTPTLSDLESTIHEEALFSAASEVCGESWLIETPDSEED